MFLYCNNTNWWETLTDDFEFAAKTNVDIDIDIDIASTGATC